MSFLFLFLFCFYLFRNWDSEKFTFLFLTFLWVCYTIWVIITCSSDWYFGFRFLCAQVPIASCFLWLQLKLLTDLLLLLCFSLWKVWLAQVPKFLLFFYDVEYQFFTMKLFNLFHLWCWCLSQIILLFLLISLD